jgi:hypothetical protein
MTNYDWYFKALDVAGDCGELSRDQLKALGISEGDPQPGFYRKRQFKDGPFVPVAIWHAEHGMVALANGTPANPSEIWTFCARNPIAEATYHAISGGAPWPDADPVVADQIAGAGHNSGVVDEAEMLRDQIEAAKTGAAAYAKITDDETSAKAQSLRSRLLELKGEAEKKHKKEKEPHLEAGRAVDKKWLPLAKDADATAVAIRTAMGAWETEKLQRQRKAERDAETARLAAQIAAEKAAQEGKPVEPVAPIVQPVAAIPTPIKGSYGRAASVGVVNVVTGITDQPALYEFLKGHPELIDFMLALARRAVAKGLTVPGVATEEQAKVA